MTGCANVFTAVSTCTAQHTPMACFSSLPHPIACRPLRVWGAELWIGRGPGKTLGKGRHVHGSLALTSSLYHSNLPLLPKNRLECACIAMFNVVATIVDLDWYGFCKPHIGADCHNVDIKRSIRSDCKVHLPFQLSTFDLTCLSPVHQAPFSAC